MANDGTQFGSNHVSDTSAAVADAPTGIIDEIEGLFSGAWSLLGLDATLSDPGDAMILGSDSGLGGGQTLSDGGLLGDTASAIGDDVTSIVGGDGTPLWLYLLIILLIVIFGAYIVREVLG